MDGLGKPLQLDGLFVGSSHSTPCFIRQQYLSGVVLLHILYTAT